MKVPYYLLAFFSLFAHQLSSQIKIYTLQECVELALSQSMEVRRAELTLAQTAGLEKVQKLSFLPTVSANAGHIYNFGRSIDRVTNTFSLGTIQNNSFSLNTQVTLYNGLQNQHNYDAAQLNTTAAQNNLAMVKNNIGLQMANLFLQNILAAENIKIAQNQIAQTKNQLELITKRYQAGAIDQGQVFSLDAQLSNDTYNLILAENNFKSSEMNIKLLLQLKLEDAIILKLSDTLNEKKLNMLSANQIYENALKLPQILQAEAQLKSSEMLYKVSLGARAPSITAFGNLNTVYSESAKSIQNVRDEVVPIGFVNNTADLVSTVRKNGDIVNTPFNDQINNNFGQSIGVQANIPIFTGGAIKNNIVNAENNLSLTKLNLENAKLQLYNDIATAVNNYEAALANLNAAQANENAQKQTLDFANQRFNAGLIGFYDFANSRTLYIASQTNVQSAKYTFLFRKIVINFYQNNTWNF